MTDAEALTILKDTRLRIEVNMVELKKGFAAAFCPFCEQYLPDEVHLDYCEYRQLLRYVSDSLRQVS